MASISASGIACAAPIVASAALLACLPLQAETILTNSAAPASLAIKVSGVKSAKGVVRMALCPAGSGFPDCGDRATRTAALSISGGSAEMNLAALPAGAYAIAVFHDANANGKLDTFMGIPKEGYGFSRNPGFKPRAPRFDETAITVTGDFNAAIKLRYIL